MKIIESVYKCWHCKTKFMVTCRRYEGQVCGSCVRLYCPFCGGNKSMGGSIMDAEVLKMEKIKEQDGEIRRDTNP